MIKSLSHVGLFETAWTVACQAALSMKFSRQEYWCELPFLSPGDLPDPEFEPTSPALQVNSLPLSHKGSLLQTNTTPLNVLQESVFVASAI